MFVGAQSTHLRDSGMSKASFALGVANALAQGAELGGPKSSAKRHAALLVGLWLVYIVASILSTEGMI